MHVFLHELTIDSCPSAASARCQTRPHHKKENKEEKSFCEELLKTTFRKKTGHRYEVHEACRRNTQQLHANYKTNEAHRELKTGLQKRRLGLSKVCYSSLRAVDELKPSTVLQ